MDAAFWFEVSYRYFLRLLHMEKVDDISVTSSKTMPDLIQVEKFLEGMSYPSSKEDIIGHARSKGADPAAMDMLERLPDDEYSSPNEVSEEMGRLQEVEEETEPEKEEV